MAYPGKVTRVGDTGDIVTQIQNRLVAVGAHAPGDTPLVVDGQFGPSTEAAVEMFQARSVDASGAALDVDGAVGPMTWAALFSDPVIATPMPENPYLAVVMAVALSQVGVMEDPLGSNRGPQVDLYLRSVGINPEDGSFAWCASFVYWCFQQAATNMGPPQTNPAPRTGGVHAMWNMAGSAKYLRYTPAQAVAAPELILPGQLFFLDLGGGEGHMGLITGVAGIHLTTVEGNTTNISGSREGIGVFKRNARTIPQISLGFSDFTRTS